MSSLQSLGSGGRPAVIIYRVYVMGGRSNLDYLSALVFMQFTVNLWVVRIPLWDWPSQSALSMGRTEGLVYFLLFLFSSSAQHLGHRSCGPTMVFELQLYIFIFVRFSFAFFCNVPLQLCAQLISFSFCSSNSFPRKISVAAVALVTLHSLFTSLAV